MSGTVTIASVALLVCVVITIILWLELRKERRFRQLAEAEARHTPGLLAANQKFESALRLSEERFQKLLESRAVGMFSAGQEFVNDANDTFLQLIGYTRDELAAHQIRWRDLVGNHIPVSKGGTAFGLPANPAELELVHRNGQRL